MKKILVSSFLVLLITFNNTAKAAAVSMANNMKTMINNPYKESKYSQEELYQDILFSMLTPYIQKAVDDYYRELLTVTPIVDPMSIKILRVDRPNGYRTFYFIIETQVMPYIGPHNSVGTDNVTISVGGIGEVKILKFKHIEDHPLPPNYLNIIKKKL
ncbi:DUF3888 domain-containing protein [Clostridium sp. YIM B02551]|uniref:DUF3888 domain-containing protein n=1 Tax=Clostridium sp. YIM B02551 TaxID=2910679 RepID=UPI001EEC4CF7|nr:DUF3888 domain-containing protein [Clostridium sp. YIM B02551]